MERRSFLRLCASLAAGLSIFGPGRVSSAITSGQFADSERILRATRKATRQFNLMTSKDLQSVLRLGKGRHILVSMQSRTDYEAGHIPGSLLFPEDELTQSGSFNEFLIRLPRDKSIILVCPNGHLSCALMLLLRQLDYDASALAFGMDGWNRRYAGSGAYQGDIGGPMSSDPTRLPNERIQVAETFSGQKDKDLLLGSLNGVFLREYSCEYLSANPDEFNLICLRRPEDYASGHIPGAINISSEAFFSGDKVILQIPRDKKLLLSCYVGHFSSAAALLMNQLGYRAYSLGWGMAGWNNRHMGNVLRLLQQQSELPVESGPGQLFLAA